VVAELLGGRLRLKRYPDCGAALKKTKKSYIYECPNPECPVIEVRFHSHGGFPRLGIR